MKEGSRHYIPSKHCEEPSQNDPEYDYKDLQTPVMSGQTIQDHLKHAFHSGKRINSSTDTDITPLTLCSKPFNSPHHKLEQVSQIPLPMASATQSCDKSQYHQTTFSKTERFDADTRVKIPSTNLNSYELSNSSILSKLTGNLLINSENINEQLCDLVDTQFSHHSTVSTKEEPAASDIVPKPNFDFLQPLTSKGVFHDSKTHPNYKLPFRKSDLQTTASAYSGDWYV
jgi:hypothetical protein